MLRIISQDTGAPLDRLFEDSLRDRWFTAEQAKDYGFVDHIVSSFEAIAPRARRHPVGLTSSIQSSPASTDEGDIR